MSQMYGGSSMIKIDESAAERDIANINQAKIKLEDALAEITRLMHTAEDMKGQTGEAIAEKCVQLKKEATTLSENLDSCSKLIRKAVQDYQEKERQLDQMIKSGGGF